MVREYRRIEPSFASAEVPRIKSTAHVAHAAPVARSRPAPVGLGAGLVGLLTLALIAYGFVHRDENWFTPEHGTGYWFGIAGSIAMLNLLIYPLRKRLKSLRSLGKLPQWLKFHMFLGLMGPTLILFHANFKLGATTSTVALASMLTVMLSGIVGRYIYGKTHHRLSGELKSLQELRQNAQDARGNLHLDLLADQRVQALFNRLEHKVMNPDHGLVGSTIVYLSVSSSLRGVQRRVARMAFARIDETARQQGLDRREVRARKKATLDYLTFYLTAVGNAAQFKFYERVFALWHVLHVPLLFVLVAAAIVHIVAVHLY